MNINDLLPLVKEKAASAAALGNSVRFDVGDDTIHVDGTGDSNVVSIEKKDADCTVSASNEDFQQLLSGELNPMTAVMEGKVRISGDMSVAMKLSTIFSG